MKRQRGAAILTAMLTVVLVATLAASSLWQQWRGVEVESAERARVQSAWVLTGSLDWARLILREDGRKGGADYLGEPWAVPLAQARLSTFLAADRSDVLEADAQQDAFLSGQITDLQSRLNVTNLVQGGKIDVPSQIAFARLFELLRLPEGELAALVENLRQARGTASASVPAASAPAAGAAAASAAAASAAAPSGAVPSGAVPLLPQTVDQLAWLGLSRPSIELLRPFIAILPVPTPVNLNTAPAEVIYACVEAFSQADAQRLVEARSSTHLVALNDASKLSGNSDAKFNEPQHSVSSRFFEVRGQLRLESTVVQELSVVQRDGMEVKVLWRERGVASPEAVLQ